MNIVKLVISAAVIILCYYLLSSCVANKGISINNIEVCDISMNESFSSPSLIKCNTTSFHLSTKKGNKTTYKHQKSKLEIRTFNSKIGRLTLSGSDISFSRDFSLGDNIHMCRSLGNGFSKKPGGSNHDYFCEKSSLSSGIISIGVSNQTISYLNVTTRGYSLDSI